MLENLVVNNIALISNAEINFKNGLNALTGETGAGKSILIDSIGLLLGDRTDKTLLRTGESLFCVKGLFLVESYAQNSVEAFFEKYDLSFDGQLFITRQYDISGRSEIKVNGQAITLSMLKELSALLVDSYGQNENQTIFNPASHIAFLDEYGKIRESKQYKEYQTLFAKLKELNKSIASFGGNDEERLRTIDLYQYQIREIENAKISVQDYEDTLNRKKILASAGKIISNVNLAQNSLNDGTVDKVSFATQNLNQAEQYDSNLSDLAARLNSVKIELNDILDSLSEYSENFDFSDDEQNKIEDRIDLYNSLFRKYGKSVEEVLEYLNETKQSCNDLINAKDELIKLETEKQNLLKSVFAVGGEIHNLRQKVAKDFCDKVLKNLANLGMKNAKLKFDFQEILQDENKIYGTGLDKVELMFSANLGEDEKPISKIASGGEISRFMLALKAVMADSDQMPTMIFDEIDTGISGAMSEAVAKLMAIISKRHQVIVVTHSQQIASMADHNFLIYKLEENGKTQTHIIELDIQGKIKEVARFMSGEKPTEISLKNAQEMIEEQEKFKQSIN